MYNHKVKYFPDGTEQHFVYADTVNGHKKVKLPSTDENNLSQVKSCIERKEIDNQKRARQEVFDLCRANKFDFFITLTFNPLLLDSYDYDLCVVALRKFTRWLTDHECQYIIVPEQHQSGRWHFHGLVKGDLKLQQAYNSSTGKKIRDLYNIYNYELGFSTASYIKDSAKVSTYITKYLSKAMIVPKGRKRYWCSHNLVRPRVETEEVDINPYMLLSCLSSYEKHVKSKYCEYWFYEISSSEKSK